MMNKHTGGTTTAGAFRTLGNGGVGGRVTSLLNMGTVARTDTVPKNLGKLPLGARVIGAFVSGAVASNAGTTAVVDVGKTGTQAFYVDDHNVRGAGNGDACKPATAILNNAAVADQGGVQVTATYAETGGASNTGGPWTVFLLVALGA